MPHEIEQKFKFPLDEQDKLRNAGFELELKPPNEEPMLMISFRGNALTSTLLFSKRIIDAGIDRLTCTQKGDAWEIAGFSKNGRRMGYVISHEPGGGDPNFDFLP